MAESAYPTDSQISTFVTNSGVVLPSGYVFTNYGAAASAWWEEQTGYQPFLQTASATRTFNPPGDQPKNRSWTNLQWGGGTILNLNAAIANQAAFVSLSVQGVTAAWTLGTNFWLEPINAPAQGQPYTRIRFSYPIYGAAYCVSVTALWGWGATIPEDAFQAILRKGAQMAMVDILEGIATATLSIYQGDERFVIEPRILMKSGEGWGLYADRAAERYKFRNWGLI
jgi:hypothetical protein